MKKSWLLFVLPVAVLVGCTPNRTLETLVPRNALAVALVDHPAYLTAALDSSADVLPLRALNSSEPWAAAALPTSPPSFFLALALAEQASAWDEVRTWAQRRGGLAATRVGIYAVLYTPGNPPPTVLEPSQRFDLAKVRAGNAPLAAYFDLHNLLADPDFSGAARQVSFLVPWVQKNLLGLRVDVSPRDGGLEATLTTDWTSLSPMRSLLVKWPASGDLSRWSGLLPERNGVGIVAALSPSAIQAAGLVLEDPSLRRRWAALVPLLGPRFAVALNSGENGTFSWVAAVESRDPQAIRQALKTLVAGGELQRNFPRWALDGDTPLVYQDKPDGLGGVRAQVLVGPSVVSIGYGADRVALAGGGGAADAYRTWESDPPASAPWFHEVPPGASAVIQGSLGNQQTRGAVRVLADGNLEAKFWVDGPGLRAWKERLPQLTAGWQAAPAGSPGR